MDEKRCTDNQSWKSKSITNLLHEHTRGTQGWRGNVGAAVVVDHDTNGDVNRRYTALTDQERSSVVVRVAHLCHDGEKSRGAGVREDERGYCGYSLSEAWVLEQLEV